jgi:hypothetical protein
VDGTPAADDMARELPAGWHALELTATFREPHRLVTLEWLLPGAADWAAIPQAYLHTHPEGHGLLGRYFASALSAAGAAAIATPPDYTRIDSAVSFDWVTDKDDPPPAAFAARPSTMEWLGTVEVPEGNTQTLRLEATTPAEVFLNNVPVLTAPGTRDAKPVETEIAGLQGRVPILVRSVRPENDNREYWKLRLLWGQPGGGWTAFVRYHPPQDDRGS